MKLEPIKKAKLPKYAAALAALVSGVILTACGETRLGGDVAMPIETQESQPNDELEYEGDVNMNLEPAPAEAFAEQSRDVLLQAAADADFSDANDHADTVQYHGRWTTCAFRDTAHHVIICFYDSAEEPFLDIYAEKLPDCDDLPAWYAHFAKQTFDWGFADVYDPEDRADSAPNRIAFVDIAKYDTLTADDAAQILSDLLAMETDSAGEEESA